MNDTARVFLLIAVILGAVVFLRWWGSKAKQMQVGATPGSGGGPAYADTAADNSISVTGVPEEGSCPGKSARPTGGGASTEGGYTCH